MSQPKTPPLSLRVPPATKAAVEKWATERGIPRNAAYVELIQRGLKLVKEPSGVAPLPAAPAAAADAPARKPRAKPDDEPKFQTRLKGHWKAP